MLSKSYDETRGFPVSRPRSASASVSQRFAFSRPLSGGRGDFSKSGGIPGSARGFQALQAAVSCAIESSPSSAASSLDPIGEDAIGRSCFTRPRSESFDVQSSQLSREGEESEAAKNMSYLYLAAVGSLEDEEPKQVRRRSQSCSVPSVSSSSAVSTMLDKPMGEELQCILGGDS